MDADLVVTVGQQAMKVMVLLAAPLLLSALIVGLLVGMLQAATQINEMTLSFIPKLMVVVVVLAIASAWMLGVIVDYTQELIENLPMMVG